MKVDIEWLRDYSEIDVSSKELADKLTMTGSKVEGVETKGNDIKNVVVGKILDIKKHPDADKLIVTQVDIGTGKVQIVTGADNVKVGDIIPIAKDGSELPGGVKIKKGLLRGEESCGMMCSIGELGLTLNEYPDQIEHGIMILPSSYEKFLGMDIVEVLNLKKEIIEFEITPNRPDCLSVEGLGRETAVSLGKEFKNIHKNLDELNIENKKEIGGLKVEIKAPDLCYRYVARVVKNVKIGPSPEWMRKRLNACGMRAINNIVDITNYVMLEMGQPMHAFDINSVEGKHIIVRRAEKNEEITTLDEQKRNLNEDMLVIADEKKPVAIAGVMGGLNSEIENDTEMVVFESAVFNGGSVRLTAKEVGLRTEASSRYEKGLSPENALRAANRAVELVKLIGAGEEVEGVIDVYPTKQKENRIEIDPDRINALLGTDITRDEMDNIFKNLGIKVEGNIAIPPFFRQDIEGEADIAEEVLRIYGYDKLDSSLIHAETTVGGKNRAQKMEDNLKNLLKDKGFSEIYTYGFINEKDLEKCNLKEENKIKILNPVSEEFNIMRPSTIPSMLNAISFNAAQKNENVRLFDISRVYYNNQNQIQENKLPEEENILTIAMYGNCDFYDIKGYVENVLKECNVKRYEIRKEESKLSYHPGRAANICVGKDTIITFGEIHPIVQENYGIGEKVYLAEIHTDKILKYAAKEKKYTPIPKYPAVERDIAIIVGEEVEVGEIERVISKKCRKVLEELKLFDVYRSEKLGENKKSVAYAIKFRAEDRTLTEDEINTYMATIINDLEKELKANLRT